MDDAVTLLFATEVCNVCCYMRLPDIVCFDLGYRQHSLTLYKVPLSE